MIRPIAETGPEMAARDGQPCREFHEKKSAAARRRLRFSIAGERVEARMGSQLRCRVGRRNATKHRPIPSAAERIHKWSGISADLFDGGIAECFDRGLGAIDNQKPGFGARDPASAGAVANCKRLPRRFAAPTGW